MDNYMRRQLDRYIMGESLTRTDVVGHQCPSCGFRREIGMMYELGRWFYHPVEQEDLVECPSCQQDMEIID